MDADAPGREPDGAGRGVTRRELATRLIGLGMLGMGVVFLQRIFFPRRLAGENLRTFEAFLDTLLPGSDLPSWRATGVMPRLLDELSAERKTRRALAEGVEWLDAEARRRAGARFSLVGEETRTAVVAAAEASPAGSIPAFFYRVTRDRTVRLHFSHPALWRKIGLPHEPQPDGYRDFEDAPAS
jgi:hypothetical protein